MDSKAGSMDPNIDPSLTSQLGQLVGFPLEIKTEPDLASTAPTRITTGLPDASSWPYDDCWHSTRPIEPAFWA